MELSSFYGGPQLSRQNQRPQGKTKNLTAKTKYLTEKPKTSRQNPRPRGKTKYFTAKTKYFTSKPNTSRQKQILTTEANTLQQKQIPHGKSKTHGKCKYFKAKAKTHGKSKYMNLTLEEGSLEPKDLAKDVGPGGKSSMAAFDEWTCFAQTAVQKLRRQRTLVSLPIVLRALSNFRLLLFLLGYPARSLWNRSKALSFAETPAGYPNKNSNNRKIEKARRTMGRQTQTRPDSELLSCESFIWNNTDKKNV